MPENGITGSTSFENLVREYRGRPPTAKETQRILACNRLLTTTDFDPVTVFLTVFGEEFDRAAERMEAVSPMSEKTLEALAARLERVEQKVDHLAKRKPAAIAERTPRADGPFAGVLPYFLAFCGGVVVAEALFFALGNAWLSAANGLSLFVLGLSATAAILIYLWLAQLYVAWRDRRW
jgi:hypothetical protein